MLPITYLPDKLEVNSSNTMSSFYRLRAGRTVQERPHNIPTAYSYVGLNNASTSQLSPSYSYNLDWLNRYSDDSPWQLAAGYGFHGNPRYGSYGGPGGVYAQEAVAYARAKFIDEISDRSEWLVNLAERKQAVSMISDRAGRMLRFCKALQKYDRRFGEASKKRYPQSARINAVRGILATLGKVVTPKNWHPRQVSRGAASAFLELHFGWEPLVKDIHAAVNVLQCPLKASHIKAKGRGVPIQSSYSSGVIRHAKVVGTCKGFVSAQVEVVDPNLWLANSLGLINPATVVWELIPFSFVVDWFVNVGQFLSQFSDTVGLKITNPCYGWKTTITHDLKAQEYWYPYPGIMLTSTGVHYRRIVGLPSVNLVTKTYRGISVTRGATAISLLIQQGIQPLARR